jgi:hypothetical protein
VARPRPSGVACLAARPARGAGRARLLTLAWCGWCTSWPLRPATAAWSLASILFGSTEAAAAWLASADNTVRPSRHASSPTRLDGHFSGPFAWGRANLPPSEGFGCSFGSSSTPTGPARTASTIRFYDPAEVVPMRGSSGGVGGPIVDDYGKVEQVPYELCVLKARPMQSRLLHTAGRLLVGARRRILLLPAGWPWAAAFARRWAGYACPIRPDQQPAPRTASGDHAKHCADHTARSPTSSRAADTHRQARRNRRRHHLTRSFGAGGAPSRQRGTVAGWRCAVTANACATRMAALATDRWVPAAGSSTGRSRRQQLRKVNRSATPKLLTGDVRARHTRGAVQSGNRWAARNDGQRPVVTAAPGLLGPVPRHDASIS